MKSAEIRSRFLEFFRDRGHVVVPSSSLVPSDDPTLLFTSAGMVQFKRNWATDIALPYVRAATCQKCMRAGGKDSDLDKVGTTGRHHTFFEMLGNFSFGDYFKEEAISWAWEFVTGVLGMDPARLWVSYYEEDEETKGLWMRLLPESRIVPLGAKDNFWGPAGDTGPCGPCTEIYIDDGPQAGCDSPHCKPGCDCGRFLEFWNLVFPQFDQQPDGTRLPLKRRGVDTGMGLERIARILQRKPTNYDTDLFAPIMDAAERISGARRDDERMAPSFRILSDHTRAAVFLIDDGVMPSNEGRGYVLRRVIRRACMAGLRLGAHIPLLGPVAEAVMAAMSDVYPTLREHARIIRTVLEEEEARFGEMIGTARRLFDDIVEHTAKNRISGQTAFRLYDTYGIPRDIIEELASEAGAVVDWEGFSEEMEKQQAASRSASAFSGRRKTLFEQERMAETVFLGYETLEADCTVTAAYERQDGRADLVTDRTPFYPERGGQVGDRGTIEGPCFRLAIEDTQPDEKGLIHHLGRFEQGSWDDITAGMPVRARVDAASRAAIAANHTATHLLHYALRRILGPETRQAGSRVAADRLRFDFICFREVSHEEIRQVEETVRSLVLADLPVSTIETTVDEARASGAVALFIDRYGEKVRVVRTGQVHAEVCGGTHVARTGQILAFKIVSSSSIGRNLRRVEAVTAAGAFQYYDAVEQAAAQSAAFLGTGIEQLPSKVQRLLEEMRQRESLLSRYLQMAVGWEAERIRQSAQALPDGGCLVIGQTDLPESNSLGRIADRIVESCPSAVVMLGAPLSERLLVVIKVGPAAAGRWSAADLMKNIAKIIGGGGGGSREFAQGSGKNASSFPDAATALKRLVGAQ